MLQAEIIRPDALTGEDRDAWLALRTGCEAFASPLLGPDFAQAVGRVRKDAAVAVFRRDGRPVGFLAHHRRPNGLARPIGAPFADYHALVAEPDLTAVEALNLAGLHEYRFTALVDPHHAFTSAVHEPGQGHAIAIGAGEAAGTDYLEALRVGSPKRFKNLRRLDHKMEREVGPVVLSAPDHDHAHFETMLTLKAEQFRLSGLHDVFRPAWVATLMRGLFEQRSGPVSGLMITLCAGDRPAVMHFGIREGLRFHPWIASKDPHFAAYSPGQVMLWRVIEAMPPLGLQVYDLSGGHDHYKAPFASAVTPTSQGSLRVSPGFQGEAWRLAESALGSVGVSRVRRRLDQIASVELTLSGRVAGMAQALGGYARRTATRPEVAQVAAAEV